MHAREYLAWVVESTTRLARCRSTRALLDAAHDAISVGLGYDYVALLLFDRSGRCVMAHNSGASPPPLPSDYSDHAWLDDPRLGIDGPGFVYRATSPSGTTTPQPSDPANPPAPYLIVSLRAAAMVRGAIWVDNRASSRPLTPDGAAPLVALANILAAALEHVGLLEEREQGGESVDTDVQRRLENQEEAVTAARAAVHLRDQVLATVSHDLRNPLTIIKGRVNFLQELIKAGRLDDRRLQAELARVEATTNKLTRLINDLLDVSQVQAGEQLALVLAPTDLAALARAVVAEQQVLGRHTITLRAPQAPVVGYWDAFRLERVLTNVLANAIKYTPDGGHIEVEIIHEREQVAVTIRDSGVGIPAADLPHVFKQYYQAANGPRGNGRGIGLTISQHIIEQHGGVITIQSEERQGTTVQFSLPDGAPRA